MQRRAAVLAALLASLAAGPAAARSAPCWLDRGAVVVSAALGDITGDFILDLAAPKSILHLDRAQLEGIVASEDAAPLTVAGERMATRMAIASIDARSLGLPSTINGLIGADVLSGYVVDLGFAPCRLTLWRRRAPPLRHAIMLPVTLVAGVPTIRASISDGPTSAVGQFAISTDVAGVRIASRSGRLSRPTRKGLDLAARYRPPARLAALGVAGEALVNLPASLEPDAPAGIAGEIGDDVWSRYRLRLDLRRGQLWLAPAAKPVSGRRRARSAGS